jgi:FKBP-type peptidyl-prolyl cis-trans isomerase
MKKISKNEVVAIVTALVVIAGFVVFGSLGLFSKTSSSLSLNNLNMNIADNGAQQAPQLIISDLVVGTGTEAVAGKHIVVNYRGTLMNGTEFDSSYSRGVPFDFDLGAGQVIAGWDQGFSGMKVGGKRKLVIPANLAYGDREIGPIPANSTLVFEVELLEVK